ncbi:MAG: glycerophosphodiester phosphodiesterase [Pseudomonadales bacterium]|nr:glycerophosphodiester phosphodiesterase [Pseudomonadales bacterium]
MRSLLALSTAVILSVLSFAPANANAKGYDFVDVLNHWGKSARLPKKGAQLGPRPFYLVDDMDEGYLKKTLKQCAKSKSIFVKSDFSIGHRGAPMQFPEHTKESYIAAAKMGAGILECDVTFTKDRELVCRHSQCDLHTTTNILATPLGDKCSVPFTPADPVAGTPATAKCCTSDITLEEYKSLCGKMDAANSSATTVEEYLDGTANWRTDLYSTCGTLMTHKESIKLFKKLGRKFTPELKSPSVDMPFEGDYTQEDYAQQLINEYKEAGVHPKKVWAQSFNRDDVLYWIENEPRFGKQAVFLDDRVYSDPTFEASQQDMNEIAAQGIRIVAPPMWALLTLDADNKIVMSDYAKYAKNAGLDIITWTLERSGPLANGGGWYHQTITDAINNDGDTMNMLHVLAKDVGVLGVFSDWPATTTFYANCMGLK